MWLLSTKAEICIKQETLFDCGPQLGCIGKSTHTEKYHSSKFPWWTYRNHWL